VEEQGHRYNTEATAHGTIPVHLLVWLTTLTAAVVAPSASSAGAVRAPLPRSRDRHWVGFDDAVAAVAAQPGVRARRTRHHAHHHHRGQEPAAA
jgi:hypothetical protein